ncbi:MAG: hypothetical protein ACX931_15930 [Saccharospirillum sp.]
MKALLINAQQKTIETVDVQSKADIAKLVGYDTLEKDEIGPEGDVLFFDEECFLRGTEGRFQIDSVVPVSGVGVIVGSTDGGDTLSDVHSDEAAIAARLKYL